MDNDGKRQAKRRHTLAGAVRLAILLGVLLSSGCDKAMKSYDLGVDLLSRERYDQAVDKLDLAYEQCRKKRGLDCSMFEEKLMYARRIAGEHYYNLAQMDLVERRLESAKRNISKAVEYEPLNAAYIRMRERILDEMLGAEALRRDALKYAADRQWDAAIEAMEKALEQFSNMPGAQRELDKIKKDAYGFYLGKARGLLAEDRWDEAIEECNRALQ